MNRNLRICLTTTIFFLAAGMGAATTVSAQVLPLEQIDIDDSIAQDDSAYSIPTSVKVVPIYRPSSDFTVRDTDWYRGLYYFLVAGDNHAGFTDIPFHYVVSSDGRVFEGNSGGEERKINIEGLGDQQVVIGYLADRSDTSFDPRAERVVAELAVSIASKHSIKLNRISVTGVEYIRDDEAQTVQLKQAELFGSWSRVLSDAVEASKFLYSPGGKNYELSVSETAQLPAGKVEYGDTVTGTITVENTGKFGIYAGTVSEIIATKLSGSSKFYNRNTWLSSSQFSLMGADQKIRPGEQLELEFKMKIPLIWGKFTEKFRLQTIDGSKVSNTTFSLTLDIKKPKGTIVEVRPTETGWLRVRSQPSGAAAEMGRISTGERYFQTKNANNGWVRLDLGGGKQGWASIQYLRYL